MMAHARKPQLSGRGFRKPTVSKSSLFCVVLAGFALNLCPLIAFYTDTDNPDLCFVNWRNVLFTGYYFINLGRALLWSSIRQFVVRYGPWRAIWCVLFIIVTSYLFVAFALDRMALFTWDKFESNLRKRFDDNVVTINETRIEFVRRDILDERSIFEQHWRYIGEDVRFTCKLAFALDVKIIPDKNYVIWLQNLVPIKSSSQYHIKTFFEEIPRNNVLERFENTTETTLYWYQFESVLEIYLIEEDDFGSFSCNVAEAAIQTKESQPTSSKPPSPGQRPEPKQINSRTYLFSGEFLLTKVAPNSRTISAPIGSIIATSASYMHLDDSPIDFDHDINDRTFDTVCGELDQSCSIFVYLYWLLWHDDGHFTSLPVSFAQPMLEGIGGYSWQCVCPYTYGLQKFIFYRQFYNITLGVFQIIGIEYPDTVELTPEEPNILDPYFNGTKYAFELPETSCWGNFETTVCVYLHRILKDVASHFFFWERILFLMGIGFCLVSTILLSKLALVWITNPCINIILGRTSLFSDNAIKRPGTLAGIANMDNTDLKYDLFISCASEQNHLASEASSYLQSRGLRVSHCDADVLGNEITIQGTSRLITESWKFLVIVTPDYVNSGLQNNFEMQLILKRLHDGFISDNNIALIPTEPYLIPDCFNRFKQFYRTHDMMEKIMLWVGPSKFTASTCNTVTLIRPWNFHFTSLSIVSLCFLCFCCVCIILHRLF